MAGRTVEVRVEVPREVTVEVASAVVVVVRLVLLIKVVVSTLGDADEDA